MDNTVEIIPPRRDAYGRWLRGTPSPNPSGCIPRDGREVLELAREGSLAAMRRLIAIVDDPEAPYAAQIAASVHILNRAFGTPKIATESGERGRSLEEILCELHEKREAKQAQERAEQERPATKNE